MELNNPSPKALAITVILTVALTFVIAALSNSCTSHGTHQRISAAKDAKNAENCGRCNTEKDKMKISLQSSNSEARYKDRLGKLRMFDAFATHNWGADVHNRDNHERVKTFVKELQKKCFRIWFDEERMTGDIMQQMCDGIDGSKFVIVFVTRSYIDKVNGKGPKGDKDNCLLEFRHAARRKGSSKLIAVVMEDVCSDSSEWEGPVGMNLGGHLFFSYTNDTKLQDCVKKVSEEITRRIDDSSNPQDSDM